MNTDIDDMPTAYRPEHSERVRVILKERGVWFSDAIPDMLGVRDG